MRSPDSAKVVRTGRTGKPRPTAAPTSMLGLVSIICDEAEMSGGCPPALSKPAKFCETTCQPCLIHSSYFPAVSLLSEQSMTTLCSRGEDLRRSSTIGRVPAPTFSPCSASPERTELGHNLSPASARATLPRRSSLACHAVPEWSGGSQSAMRRKSTPKFSTISVLREPKLLSKASAIPPAPTTAKATGTTVRKVECRATRAFTESLASTTAERFLWLRPCAMASTLTAAWPKAWKNFPATPAV
mmetsp:Transcript_60731/g.131638  ORF Transcript_60731/g.131638 Transcript_60731/m.131638 type:complete len:244 (+) Transcript_60731:921-1652(+)